MPLSMGSIPLRWPIVGPYVSGHSRGGIHRCRRVNRRAPRQHWSRSTPTDVPLMSCWKGSQTSLPRDYPLTGDRLRNRRIRSSIGGCVLKRANNDSPDSGLTMNRWAVAGFASMGSRCEA